MGAGHRTTSRWMRGWSSSRCTISEHESDPHVEWFDARILLAAVIVLLALAHRKR